MAVITYETLTPSLIENTDMQKVFRDGVFHGYYISPVDGYVLHDNAGDWTDENGTVYLAFFTGTCSCGASYDFTANPREFYAVPRDSVPADQIFGVGDNDHEVM